MPPILAHRLVHRRPRLIATGTVALAGLILFLRRPDALLNPQLFAEDGMFFLDAYDRGAKAVFSPYNGYLHLAPRLTAWLALAFDPAWMPAIYNGITFALWLGVALALFSPRLHLPVKPALALALVLVPHTGEVLINLTNVIWPLALGLVLLLVAEDADTPVRRVFDRVVVFFCGLSGPFSIFLFPLFALRAATRRTRESVWLALLVAVVAGIQAAFVIRARATFARPGPMDPGWLLSVMGGRLFGTFFAGYGLHPIQTGVGWLALALGITALGGFAVFRASPWSTAQKTLAGAWLCLTVPVAVKFLREAGAIAPTINGDRYFFLAHVVLAWILLTLSVSLGGWKRIVILSALTAAFLANLPYLRVPPLPDLAWSAQVQPIREGKGFHIPIGPDGWYVQSAGRNSRH